MGAERISVRQSVCIIVLICFGSSIATGANTEAGQDTWIAMILTVMAIIPLITVYARIIKLFPQKDIFEITQELFGKFFGKIIIFLFAFYAAYVGASVLRDYTEYIQIASMPETPQIAIMVSVTLVACYLAKSSISTLGRWCVVSLYLIVLVILSTLIMSIGHFSFTNLLPVMEHDFPTILKTSSIYFALPFGESVLFLALADSLRKKDSPYKIYLPGIVLVSLLIMVIFIRNLLVLGGPMMQESYFPSYTTARIINLGDFLSRIEGSISYNLILSGVTKLTICIIAASKGFSALFGTKKYRSLVFPISLLIITLSIGMFRSILELIGLIQIYYIYSGPFYILIPLLLWIIGEIKLKLGKPKLSPTKAQEG